MLSTQCPFYDVLGGNQTEGSRFAPLTPPGLNLRLLPALAKNMPPACFLNASRPPGTPKNRVEMRDFFHFYAISDLIFNSYFSSIFGIRKWDGLTFDSRRMTTIFFYGFHILFKLVVIYYRSVPIAVRENLSAKNTCLDIFYRGLLLVSRL